MRVPRAVPRIFVDHPVRRVLGDNVLPCPANLSHYRDPKKVGSKLGSNSCQIRSKTGYYDAEQSQANQSHHSPVFPAVTSSPSNEWTARCLPHPEDRVYTVISGVFYIGLGDEFDSSKLEAYPPGAVIILAGNTPPFPLGEIR